MSPDGMIGRMKPTLAEIEVEPRKGPKKDSAYLACPVHSAVHSLDILHWQRYLVLIIERNKCADVFPDAKKVMKNSSRT